MKNIKNTITGAVYPNKGTYTASNGSVCYKTGEYQGVYAQYIEFTNEPVWLTISFNLRLGYNPAMDLARKIKELGGDGNITVGGSWYFGSQDMLSALIQYATEKEYCIDSLSFKMPNEATAEKVETLRQEGVIE